MYESERERGEGRREKGETEGQERDLVSPYVFNTYTYQACIAIYGRLSGMRAAPMRTW